MKRHLDLHSLLVIPIDPRHDTTTCIHSTLIFIRSYQKESARSHINWNLTDSPIYSIIAPSTELPVSSSTVTPPLHGDIITTWSRLTRTSPTCRNRLWPISIALVGISCGSSSIIGTSYPRSHAGVTSRMRDIFSALCLEAACSPCRYMLIEDLWQPALLESSAAVIPRSSIAYRRRSAILPASPSPRIDSTSYTPHSSSSWQNSTVHKCLYPRCILVVPSVHRNVPVPANYS